MNPPRNCFLPLPGPASNEEVFAKALAGWEAALTRRKRPAAVRITVSVWSSCESDALGLQCQQTAADQFTL